MGVENSQCRFTFRIKREIGKTLRLKLCPSSLVPVSLLLFRQTLIISQRQQYTVSYGNKVCITDAVLPCGTDKEIL